MNPKELVESDVNILSTSQDIPDPKRPRVISITEAKALGKEINHLPYQNGKAELLHLAEHFQTLPDSEEGMRRFLKEKVGRDAGIFNKIIPDIISLRQRLTEAAAVIDNDANLIYSPYSDSISLQIGEKAQRALFLSRFLGLVPLFALDRLAEMKIVIVGASAASSAVVELAPFVNSTFYDDDTLSVSKVALIPGATQEDVGKFKAWIVEREAYGKYSYGNFRGVIGRIIMPKEHFTDKEREETAKRKARGFQDTLIQDAFAGGVDLVIEAADGAIKTPLRLWLAKNYPEAYLLMTTDVGARGYVSVEKPSDHQHYNQGLSEKVIDKLQKTPTNLKEFLAQIYYMVKSDFPWEHKVEFLLAAMNVIPYWSQMGFTGRETGTIVAKLAIKLAHAGKLEPGIVSIENTPTNLGFDYSKAEQKKIRKLCHQIFKLPA